MLQTSLSLTPSCQKYYIWVEVTIECHFYSQMFDVCQPCQMPFDQISVDQMSVDQMSVDQMSVDQMYVDQMSIDQMSID